MGFDYEKPFKPDETKMLSFKVKCANKEDKVEVQNMAQSIELKRDPKAGYVGKTKTELGQRFGEFAAYIVSSNKEHEVELDYTPE